MLEIRKAAMTDLNDIMQIYAHAQEYMINSGNPNQWGRTYPNIELIQEDINSGIGYVICENDKVHGVFALIEGIDETYLVIEDGKWLNDDPYVTIHRIAGDGQVKGIFACAVNYCKEMASNVRIDTHHDNKTMQHLIEKHGFIKCGIIYTRDKTKRLAYQWEKG